MNKYIFFSISLIFALVLIASMDIIGTLYYTGDDYVSPETALSETSSESISLEEYKEKLANEEIVKSDVNNLPFELQLLNSKVFIARIMLMILGVLCAIAIGNLIEDKIKFDLLLLNTKQKKLNIVRITLYILMLITIIFISQIYPAKFILGWVQTFIWVIAWFILIVWVLNIADALISRKNKKLKGSIKKVNI